MNYESRYDWSGAKTRRRNHLRFFIGFLIAAAAIGAIYLIGALPT